MVGLSLAAVLVAGCDKGTSSRLFTDDELAALEAKARPHAAPDPASIIDVSMLSLRPLETTLAAIRKEPDPSVALARAMEQFAWVRQLGSGKDSLVRMSVRQAGERMIADTLSALLHDNTIPAPVLDTLAATLDDVIANQPRITAAFAGDLRWLRGSLLAKQFVPSSGSHDPKDELALTLAAIDALEPAFAAACPPSATLATCKAKLPLGPTRLSLPGTFIDEATDAIRAANTTERHRLQGELTHKAADNQLGGYTMYVFRAASSLSRLVALRVEVEVLRRHTCNVPPELLSPPLLGDPVRALRSETMLKLSPPTWASTEHPDHWDVPCPDVDVTPADEWLR